MAYLVGRATVDVRPGAKAGEVWMDGRKGLLAGVALTILAGMGMPAWALEIAGLNQRNELLLFADTAPGKVKTVPVTGVKGTADCSLG